MANKYNFDESINRRLTHSYKWNIKENEISLSIADSDFFVPTEVKNAIKLRAEQATYGYTYVPSKYYDAYIYWWNHRYQTSFNRAWFCFSSSIVASIDVLISRLSNEGDKIAVFSPDYNVFYNCILNNKREIREVVLPYKNDEYEIDYVDLENAIKESKIFILCNPLNPVGKQFSEYELKTIISLCEKYDTYLLSDEIHADLDYNEKRYFPAIKVKDFSKLITLLSPGKTFNLAGLHSSVVITSNIELKEKIEKWLGEADVGEPQYFSIEPVIAAYTKCERYVDELNEYIKNNRILIEKYLQNNGLNLKIIGGHATYLLWIDISFYSKNSEQFCNDFKDKCGVVVLPGSYYKEHNSSFIRINIATQRKVVEEFLTRLTKFLKENF